MAASSAKEAATCSLTSAQIRPFIPKEGITLAELEAKFSEIVLPLNPEAAFDFIKLVTAVADASEGRYFPKPYAGYGTWDGAVVSGQCEKSHEMSRYDPEAKDFRHTVTVHADDAFVLRPVCHEPSYSFRPTN